MKRNTTVALTVIAATVVALIVGIGTSTVDENISRKDAVSVGSKAEIVNSAKEAPIVEPPVVDGEDDFLEEEIADNDFTVAESADTNSAIALSVESQEFVRALVYEALASSEISSVAYLEKIECGHSNCSVEVTFYNALPIYPKTASLMSDMNARLDENPSTNHLQFGFTSIKRGDDGLGETIFVMMPKPERQFDVSIMLDLDEKTSPHIAPFNR